jgi:hypothetical protein
MPASAGNTPTRDEVLAYFAAYEAHYRLPIEGPVRVQAVRAADSALLRECNANMRERMRQSIDDNCAATRP